MRRFQTEGSFFDIHSLDPHWRKATQGCKQKSARRSVQARTPLERKNRLQYYARPDNPRPDSTKALSKKFDQQLAERSKPKPEVNTASLAQLSDYAELLYEILSNIIGPVQSPVNTSYHRSEQDQGQNSYSTAQ